MVHGFPDDVTSNFCRYCGCRLEQPREKPKPREEPVMVEHRYPTCCKYCGGPLPYSRTSYCCDECTRAYLEGERQEKVAKRNLTRNLTCRNCGGLLPNSRVWYCCDECRQEYYEKERREIGVFLIFERDGFKCIYCGRTSVEDGITLHADHIIPKSEGGESVAGNLVTACRECNLTKAGRLLTDQDRVLKEVAKRNQRCGIHDLLTIKGV